MSKKETNRSIGNLWQRRFQKLGMLGILLLTINFGYQVWYRYVAPPASPSHRQCDLQRKPCSVNLAGDRRVTLAIAPRGIPIDKVLHFSVKLDHIEADNVFLALTSKNRPQLLSRIALNKESVNKFAGNFQLNQIADEKQWIALVQVITAGENITIPFKFQAKG